MTTENATVAMPRQPAFSGVALGTAAFFLAHGLIRVFGSVNFSVDDAETAVHTQVLQPYYAIRNPPLFDWTFYFLSQLTGVNNVTIQILKTAILLAAAAFFYLAVRPAFRHRRALDAVLIAYAATAYYGWDMFQQFTHTTFLVFAMTFTLWAFMRVVRFGRLSDYLVLGIALGIGILSKYLFIIYFLGLIVAGCFRRSYRPAILTWRMGIVLVVGLVVLLPLALPLALHWDALIDWMNQRVVASSNSGVAKRIGTLLLLSAEFWLPVAAFLAIGLVGLRATASDRGAADRGGDGDPDFYPFIRDASLLLIGGMVCSVLFLRTEIGTSGGRYLVPMFSFLPLLMLLWVDRLPAFPSAAIDWFRRAGIAVIVGVAVVRLSFFLFASPPFCVPRCAVFVDYRPVAAKINELAVGKQAIILSDSVHVAADLLTLVPNSKIVMDYYTGGSALNIAQPADRRCFFVWDYKDRDGTSESLANALRETLRRKPDPVDLKAIGPIEYVTAGWYTKLLNARSPPNVYGVAMIDSASRLCDGGRIPGVSAPPSSDSML